jgi:hypothetical protein
MIGKKRVKGKSLQMKGNGNGKISYKARSTCQKLGGFFEKGCCEEQKAEESIELKTDA